jgi:Lon protease-like protein
MELPTVLPVMTLPGVTLFPHSMIPLHIFEARYRRMLDESLQTHRLIVVAMRRPGSKRETPFAVAGVGLIRASVQNKNGTSNLILQGVARAELARVVRYKPYRTYRIEALPTSGLESPALERLTQRVLDLMKQRLMLGFKVPQALLDRLCKITGNSEGSLSPNELVKHGLQYFEHLTDPDHIADLIACTLLPNPLERQMILECDDVETRIRHLIHFLELELERIGNEPAS